MFGLDRLAKQVATECFALLVHFVTLKPKYVNMADINFSALKSDGRENRGVVAPDAQRWDIIELLFFAYRDFVGDADDVLEAFGFGRAHHRVVHFVQRYPGLKLETLTSTTAAVTRSAAALWYSSA